MTTFFGWLSRFLSRFRMWVVIAPWEQCLRVRLGKRTKLLGSGVHFVLPLVDLVFTQSLRTRHSTVPTQTLTTRDGKCITLSGSITYDVSDVLKLYENLHDAEDVLQAEANHAVANYITDRYLREITPDGLSESVFAELDDRFEDFGLDVRSYVLNTFAVVRTYRLIQGEPKEWTHGSAITTTASLQNPDD